MTKSFELDEEIFSVINKQIKTQQKSIKTFPFAYILLFFLGFARNNGRMPKWYFYPISIIFLIIPYLYSPLLKGILLGKLFYVVEIKDNNTVQFTAFGTLWRKEKKVAVNLNNIKINKTPLPKLLYKKYLLNEIFIEDERYLIFNSLLEESGLVDL